MSYQQQLFTYFRARDGFTLVELMVALAITIFLLATLSTLMVISHKNFLLQDALNAIQENARTTRHILQTHIAHSGILGCARVPGYHLVGNTNELTVTGAGIVKADLLQDMHDRKVMTTTTNLHFQRGDWALIADCNHLEMFQVKNSEMTADWQHVESASLLTKAYARHATLSRFVSTTFYIANTGRRDSAGQSVSALYGKNSHGHPRELIAGIAKWQLTYDVRVANQIIIQTPAHVRDGSQLTGIHITLLFNHFPLKKIWNMYFAI